MAPQARLYLFDLAGLSTTPLEVRAEDGVALIAGWSDKAFDVLGPWKTAARPSPKSKKSTCKPFNNSGWATKRTPRPPRCKVL